MKKKLTILIVLLVILSSLNIGCKTFDSMGLADKVKVIDAYCVYSITSSFQYNFSLQNKSNDDIDAEYSWSLNDPSADGPRYQGIGAITIKGSDTEDISITVEKIQGDSDPRGCIMYVTIYENGEEIGYYRQQKSTYDWDYSVTPPVIRSVKPDYTHLWIDTLVTKDAEGYKITVSDIIFLPPERTTVLDLSNIGVNLYEISRYQYPYIPISGLISPDASALYDLSFCDNDNDGELSIGDYFTASEDATGAFIDFDSINDPSIHIYQIDNNAEKIEEENPDAIYLVDYGYEISKDYIDFYIESNIENLQDYIDNNSIRLFHPGERGSGGLGIISEKSTFTFEGSVYRGSIDLSLNDYDYLYMFIYLSNGINEAMYVICKID
jgi:hypothetical protein